MKVKDLYWAARNSTFFINLESEGRPLLCGPKVSEDGVRIRLWLHDMADGCWRVHCGYVPEGGEMSDKMKRRTLIVCAGVLVLCGLPMVVMAVVQRDARMGLYGVMSLLFALSDVLQLFLVGGCWAAPSGHDVRFEDAAGRWVYEGQLRADTVRHGVIPDRSNHQERHEILRVESFDGDVKAVQSFLNEHDAGYIAEVTPEQPIIVEALGNKACVYVTKIVQCELRDVLRLLEAK